ncbi:ThiF family adenylyltransferase, partial [Candidatus Woesearchaeota archaeon]|nr:ThiF family adenylyltransferase [Candidatus Woesearchaeota archaeon]
FNLLERLKSYFTRKLNYSTNSGDRERFSFQRLEESPIPFDHAPYQDKSVLVVGAGALGNIMAMALATMGFGTVDYLDYDTIESTNLNRQVLFYDSVGLPKAAVLAAKHAKMNPKARVRGLVQKLEVQDGVFTPDVLREEGYDLGLDLVDNLYTRAVLAAYAVLRDMPLVTAASSPTAAEVAVYVPGVTACLNHIFSDYYEKGRREEVIRRQSCIQQPDPSVIVTNQVAAALAALEICGIFDAERYGNPHNGILKYSTELEPRLGQITVKDVCECYRRKKDIPDMEIKEMKEAAHGR